LATQFGSTLPDDTTASPPVVVSSGRMPSYCTAIGFLLISDRPAIGGGKNTWGLNTTRTEWNVPSSYNCKITKVGDSARKIFIADGSKFSTGTVSPDYDTAYMGILGGAFGDQGPTKFGRSWCRDGVPGSGVGGVDCRAYWARHGPAFKKNAPPGTYRFNCAFFDGHVETLDDLTGANPYMWWPKGTTLDVSGTQMYADVIKAVPLPVSGSVVIKF
jgi:prepilin-type processing-associated H-X9-DG protein